MKEGFYSRLADFVGRRRWAVLAGYALLTAVLGLSASRTTLKTDITDLLPEGTRSADDLRVYLERFGTADRLFVTLSEEAAPGGGASGDPDALEDSAAMLRDRLEASGLFRSVRYGFSEDEGVGLIRRAMAHLPVLVPLDRVGALRDRLAPAAIEKSLQRLKAQAAGPLLIGPVETIAAEDPLGLASLLPAPGAAGSLPVEVDRATGLLLSPDGRALLMVAVPVKPPQDIAFSRSLLAAVDAARAAVVSETPGIAIDYAGGYLFAVQDEARIRHDITATASISLAAITALFALVLRRIGLLMILMVPLTLSTLWTLGVAAIHPGHLNVVTIAFAAILLGMGDDSLTHLYLRFREEIVAGAGRRAALRSAMASTGPSILVATLTSGLAFASLTIVEFRGLSELGLIAAIGMLNLLVCVLLLFPALLSLGPERPRAPLRSLSLPMGPFVRFHVWGRRRRGLVIAAAAVIAVFAAGACLQLRFSSDLRALRGEDVAQARLERVLAPFGGVADPVQIVQVRTGREEALHAAESLGPLCDALIDEHLVTGCASPAAWLPSDRSQRGRFDAMADVAWEEVARRFAEAADRLGMNESFFTPFLENLSRYGRFENVRIDADAIEASTIPGLAGNAAATALFPAPGVSPASLLDHARRIAPDAIEGTGTHAASVALVVADLMEVIENDFRRASFLALGAVAIIATIAFRTVSRTLLVGLPVAFGCLLMLGGLSVLGVPINLMNLVAAPLVFGLGVDFGVYIVNRHEEERRGDVVRVLRETGGAILLTGLTTMAGFGSLLAADFAGLRSMGWVALLGIGGCLAAALLILPLVLPGPDRQRD